jgi:hypothetical protein
MLLVKHQPEDHLLDPQAVVVDQAEMKEVRDITTSAHQHKIAVVHFGCARY